MKKTVLSIVFMLVCAHLFAQYQPSADNLQARREFQDNKFGIFLHWGIYSMLGDGEWVQENKKLNYEEYTHLAAGFYPSKFDAEEWVKAFKEAGARYITITSRHHDGFSMFKTAASGYNIVDATPFRRDVLKELAAACEKYGIRLQFYYSHLDWHRLDYPLGGSGSKLGRPTDKQDYDSYFRFMNEQLTELLTNYGKVGAIWFDGWWDHKMHKDFDWRLDEQYALIHRLQPGCLIGNNHHQAPKPGEDIQMFEQDLPGQNTAGFSGGSVIGQLPLETCMTMNRTWGYSITDKQYKSAETLIRKLVSSAGHNANYLLNIGPRPDGMLPAEALARLKAIGTWLKANGETIYGTRGGLVAPRDWGVTTQKGSTLYVHILNYQDKSLFLPITTKRVAKARMFSGKAPVRVQHVAGGVLLGLPSAPKGVDTIVELTLK
ncbi:alpha-L-fucosidase [Prevotella sp. KH2C16]|uniref:alpha-L-fucosidase n=1 Tax=Prevotella sp. KH2C16 TaxID=1855325 RepID=UPI0008E5D299|nr:alpha-L-fucosidase [Prevotella sp. KH2C16]SFG03314.1 alpha-L-fucosidase [Prevotella sp. KH2C16]